MPQPTIDSTYASNDETSGWSDAYGVSASRPSSVHSCQHGLPAACPQMSHSAMSSAPIAFTPPPRLPVIAEPT